MNINLNDIIQLRIDESLEDFNTSLPARVISYNELEQTVDVQPLLSKNFADGFKMERPILKGVPVIFPSSGSCIVSFPVNVNDNVMLQFSQTSLDEWAESNANKSIKVLSKRQYHIMDAVAIVGLYNKHTTLKPNKDDLEIRYDTAKSKIALKKDGSITVSQNGSAKFAIDKDGKITLDGEVTITGDAIIDGVSFLDHQHAGVADGGTGSYTDSLSAPVTGLSGKPFVVAPTP